MMDDAQFDELYMSAKGNCPGCGAPLTFKDAGQLALSRGLDEVVMCHNCGNVYKINLKPHVMEFTQFVRNIPLNNSNSQVNYGGPSKGLTLDPLKEFFSTKDFNIQNVKIVKIVTVVIALLAFILLVTNGYFYFSLDGIIWIIADVLPIIVAGAYIIPVLKGNLNLDDKAKHLSLAFGAAFFYLEINFLYLFSYTGIWDMLFGWIWEMDILVWDIVFLGLELAFSAIIAVIFYFVLKNFVLKK